MVMRQRNISESDCVSTMSRGRGGCIVTGWRLNAIYMGLLIRRTLWSAHCFFWPAAFFYRAAKYFNRAIGIVSIGCWLMVLANSAVSIGLVEAERALQAP